MTGAALAERQDAGNAAAAPDPLEAFELRCWARARLWQAGEIDCLHDAVDVLQESAVAWGLVESIGQDRAQAIMSAAFAAVRDDLRSETSVVSAEVLPATHSGTPDPTIEALVWCLRERELACLSEHKNRDRLARCDAAAMTLIARRLLKLGWGGGNIGKLIQVRDLVDEGA
jgi:hypothetical protein